MYQIWIDNYYHRKYKTLENAECDFEYILQEIIVRASDKDIKNDLYHDHIDVVLRGNDNELIRVKCVCKANYSCLVGAAEWGNKVDALNPRKQDQWKKQDDTELGCLGQLILYGIVGIVLGFIVSGLRGCQDDYIKEQESQLLQDEIRWSVPGGGLTPQQMYERTKDEHAAQREKQKRIGKNKYVDMPLERHFYKGLSVDEYRKLFVNIMNSHAEYYYLKNSPYKRTCEIIGDTLYMYSPFYDSAGASVVNNLYKCHYKACQFARVRFAKYKGGSYYTEYVDNNVTYSKNKKTRQKPKKAAKTRKKKATRQYTADDYVDDKVTEYLHEHGLEEADLDF